MTNTTQRKPRPVTAPMKRELERYWRSLDLWHDAQWYSKTAWRERGEPYGNDAPLSLTFEGPLYEVFNYGESRMAQDVYERTLQIAQQHGFWFELGFGWSMHFHEF